MADMKPTKGVREAAQRGIEQIDAGHGGEGLEDVTIREAHAMARGEAITEGKARKGDAWWARNQRFLDAMTDTPADVAANLWGGRAGPPFFRRVVAQLDEEQEGQNAYRMALPSDGPATDGSLVYEKDVLRPGQFVHPVTGQEFEITQTMLQELVQTHERFLANGVHVPINEIHEGTLPMGTVDKLAVKGGVLYATMHFADEASAAKANRYRFASVYLVRSYTDAEGNFYAPAILHIAMTSTPVITRQDDLAVSLSYQIPQPTGGTPMPLVMELKRAANELADDATDEQTMAAVAEAFGIGADTLTKLVKGDDMSAGAGGEGDNADGNPAGQPQTQQTQQPVAASIQQPQTQQTQQPVAASIQQPQGEFQLSADIREMMTEGTESLLLSLVQGGQLNQAASKALGKVLTGDAYMLSAAAPGAGETSRAKRILGALKVNEPHQGANGQSQTGAQALSRTDNGKPEPDPVVTQINSQLNQEG